MTKALSSKLHRLHVAIDELHDQLNAREGPSASEMHERRIVERCVMQLQVEFELFVRNFVLDCSTGRYTNSTGLVSTNLPNRFHNREKACHYLLSRKGSKREPNWAIPQQAINAAQTLQLSNFADVSAELGITPWEVDDLRYVRNYMAHRSKESAKKLRSTKLAHHRNSIDPVAIVYSTSPRGGKNFERWTAFIKGVSNRLVR